MPRFLLQFFASLVAGCELNRDESSKGSGTFLAVGDLLTRALVNCPSFVPWRSHAALAHLALGHHEPAGRLAEEELELARAFGALRALGVAKRAAGIVAGGLKPVFAEGGRWVETRVFGQEHLVAPDGSVWPVLMVGAVRSTNGAEHVVVVNRNPELEKSALVVPAGFPHDRIIDVATVHAAAITSFNDDGTQGGDNTVELTRSTLETNGKGAFNLVFPAASVTVLTLQPG